MYSDDRRTWRAGSQRSITGDRTHIRSSGFGSRTLYRMDRTRRAATPHASRSPQRGFSAGALVHKGIRRLAGIELVLRAAAGAAMTREQSEPSMVDVYGRASDAGGAYRATSPVGLHLSRLMLILKAQAPSGMITPRDIT